MSGSIFDYAWAIVKMDLPLVADEDMEAWTATTDPFEFGWWKDPEMAKKVAKHYNWPIPKHQGTVAYRWTTGPGKEKTDRHLDEVIRPGIERFGTKIQPLPDWEWQMQQMEIPPAMWKAYAENIVGNLSESEKTGHGTMTPTSACRLGKNCPKCYARDLERGIPNLTSNAWDHLNALAANPLQHASAMAFLIRNNPSQTFRHNIGGDWQSVEHIAHSLSVAAATPDKQHWFHTKDVPFLMDYLDQFEEYSPEWYDAIPEPHTFLFSQPHPRMTVGPEGGGLLGDEITSTNAHWKKANWYASRDNPQRHPGLIGTELGTSPRKDAYVCPSGMKVKDPETKDKIVPCEDFGCLACRTRGGPTVQYPANRGGVTNQPMPLGPGGPEAKAMTDAQQLSEEDKALVMAMEEKQRRESKLRELTGNDGE